ncbi:unnamed protein product, partial [Rotaria sp. Silwood1]
IGKLYHRNHARREEALDEIYQILNTFSGDQEDARAHLRAGSFVLARMFRFDVLATFSHSLKIFHLLMNDYVRRHSIQKQDIIASLERGSPSPESIYDQQGKRQNTREVRTRRKIEDQRHQFITELIVLNLDYKSPGDYKPQQMKYMDKVMIQQEDHPDVNFVSLIIGPHGNTLKMKLNLINEAENIVTNTIICTICYGAGHLTTNCKFCKTKSNSTHTKLNPVGPLAINENRQKQQKLDCEYQSLMNELMGKKIQIQI